MGLTYVTIPLRPFSHMAVVEGVPFFPPVHSGELENNDMQKEESVGVSSVTCCLRDELQK